MRFIEVNEYSEQQFMRLTGVKRGVFEMMIEVVSQSQRTFGRLRKLSVEDQVLLTSTDRDRPQPPSDSLCPHQCGKNP